MKGHMRRVARYAAGTARHLGLPREEVERVRRAAAVHDIGKLETPAAIINKPAALSDEEIAAIRRHAVAGERIIARLGDPELAAIVRHHHERVDGGGYPDGLAGDEIPLGARIVATADTFDAITSERAYRSARSHREALELIDAEAGTQLDPEVVAAFHGYYASPLAAFLRALAE
jgi:putative nucleotidyltransferase with HDIG domain